MKIFFKILLTHLIVCGSIFSRQSELVEAKVTVQLAGLIEDTTVRQVVQMATNEINQNETFLPNINISIKFFDTHSDLPFENLAEACKAAGERIWSIIGPTTSSNVQAVQYMATALAVPQFAPVASYPGFDNRPSIKYLLRMTPSDFWQSKALASIFERFSWRYSAILTSDTDYGVNSIAEFQVIASERDWKILSLQIFKIQELTNVQAMTKYLLNIKDSGAHVIILSCLSPQAEIIVDLAHRLGMTSSLFQWIFFDNAITDGKLYSNPPQYLNGALGIVVSFKRGKLYDQAIDNWKNRSDVALGPFLLRFYDAVYAFAYGLENLSNKFNSMHPTNLSCVEPKAWVNGSTLYTSIRQSHGNGASGPIGFDAEGGHPDPSFEFLNLAKAKWETVGTWSKIKGANINIDKITFMNGKKDFSTFKSGLEGQSFNVTTKLDPPFMMLKNNRTSEGNDRFEGFMKDFLEKISSDLKFTYTLRLVEDGSYGSFDQVTNKWGGMVEELINQKADIAAGAFSVTPTRAQDIDFTVPFLEQGVTILMQKPKDPPPSIFQFLAPFTPALWLVIGASLLVAAAAFYLLGTLSPYEDFGLAVTALSLSTANKNLDKAIEQMDTKDQLPDKETLREIRKNVNTYNTVFNTFTSFLQQGSTWAPRGVSSRIMWGFWWVVSCIIIATYTANLAAFLTVDQLQTTIDSLQKLAAQNKIEYGTVFGSSVQNFFQETKLSPYQEMHYRMHNVPNTEKGVNKTIHEEYAFLWDAALLYYYKNQFCNLRTVGGEFQKTGYALGLRKGSPYTKEFNVEILKLKQNGFIENKLSEWYNKKTSCGASSSSVAQSQRLDVSHMLGVFLLVASAIGCSLIALIIEWLIVAKQAIEPNNPEKPQTLWQAITYRISKIRMAEKLIDSPDTPVDNNNTPSFTNEKSATMI